MADAMEPSGGLHGDPSQSLIGGVMPPLFLTHLLRSHIEPYQRVAWFLFEAAEREQLLNLQALWRWPRSPSRFHPADRARTRDVDSTSNVDRPAVEVSCPSERQARTSGPARGCRREADRTA